MKKIFIVLISLLFLILSSFTYSCRQDLFCKGIAHLAGGALLATCSAGLLFLSLYANNKSTKEEMAKPICQSNATKLPDYCNNEGLAFINGAEGDFGVALGLALFTQFGMGLMHIKESFHNTDPENEVNRSEIPNAAPSLDERNRLLHLVERNRNYAGAGPSSPHAAFDPTQPTVYEHQEGDSDNASVNTQHLEEQQEQRYRSFTKPTLNINEV